MKYNEFRDESPIKKGKRLSKKAMIGIVGLFVVGIVGGIILLNMVLVSTFADDMDVRTPFNKARAHSEAMKVVKANIGNPLDYQFAPAYDVVFQSFNETTYIVKSTVDVEYVKGVTTTVEWSVKIQLTDDGKYTYSELKIAGKDLP